MNKDRMDISVVIPLFNKKDSVLRAINSILAQTYLPNEIIIVNDGSTDGSEKVVEQLNHPLIRLIHQENAGVSAARNKGIELAKGEWIAFLDADDYWLKDYLTQIKELNLQYPQCEILSTSYDKLIADNSLIPIKTKNISFDKETGEITNYFQIAKDSEPILWTSATVVKKKLLNKVNGFPVGIKSGEDLITWAKLSLLSHIAYSKKSLAVFVLKRTIKSKKIVEKEPDSYDYVGIELLGLYELSGNPNIKYYYGWYLKNRAMHFYLCGNRASFIKNMVKSIYYGENKKRNCLYLSLSFLPIRLYQYISKKWNTNK